MTPVPAVTDTPLPPEPPTAEPETAPDQETAATEAPVSPLPTPVQATVVPVEPVTEETPTETPVAATEAAAPEPTSTSVPGETPAPGAATTATPAAKSVSQSIVNWAKFWDTAVVAVAYPWLCCGIILLLLVPVGLLYLEIKGRRRPQTTPESLPKKDKSDGRSSAGENPPTGE